MLGEVILNSKIHEHPPEALGHPIGETRRAARVADESDASEIRTLEVFILLHLSNFSQIFFKHFKNLFAHTHITEFLSYRIIRAIVLDIRTFSRIQKLRQMTPRLYQLLSEMPSENSNATLLVSARPAHPTCYN